MMVCNDVAKTRDFFVRDLGFDLVNFDPSIGRTGFASVESGKSRVMLCSPSYYAAPKRSGAKPLTDTLYYFYIEDLLKLYKDLKNKGIKVSDPAVRFYGLKEVEVLDPDGRILIFGQETDEPPTPE